MSREKHSPFLPRKIIFKKKNDDLQQFLWKNIIILKREAGEIRKKDDDALRNKTTIEKAEKKYKMGAHMINGQRNEGQKLKMKDKRGKMLGIKFERVKFPLAYWGGEDKL